MGKFFHVFEIIFVVITICYLAQDVETRFFFHQLLTALGNLF